MCVCVCVSIDIIKKGSEPEWSNPKKLNFHFKAPWSSKVNFRLILEAFQISLTTMECLLAKIFLKMVFRMAFKYNYTTFQVFPDQILSFCDVLFTCYGVFIEWTFL